MGKKTNPIPGSLEPVPGLPSVLKLYRIPKSANWQCRVAMDGKRIPRSTKTRIKSEAIKFAKEFYNELLLKKHQNKPLTEGKGFKVAALSMIEEDKGRVARGELAQSSVDDAEYILKADLLPFFGADSLPNINYKRIGEYVQQRLQERKVSSSTIKNHLKFLRKILKHAVHIEMLGKFPTFPAIVSKDNPREWFNDEEFARLITAINKAIKDKAKPHRTVITEHLRDLTNFMVNTFLRPQDIKLLQHKHVNVVKKDGKTYLRIMATGKVKAAPVISTRAAVAIYERLKGNPDDYVFLPELKNRTYAMGQMSRQFKYVLEKAGLYQTDTGTRELYSLRHTCIMNQLLHGKWSVFLLAKNCRTSVEMIERFYASRLQPEMNIQQLHETEEGGASLDDFFEE